MRTGVTLTRANTFSIRAPPLQNLPLNRLGGVLAYLSLVSFFLLLRESMSTRVNKVIVVARLIVLYSYFIYMFYVVHRFTQRSISSRTTSHFPWRPLWYPLCRCILRSVDGSLPYHAAVLTWRTQELPAKSARYQTGKWIFSSYIRNKRENNQLHFILHIWIIWININKGAWCVASLCILIRIIYFLP